MSSYDNLPAQLRKTGLFCVRRGKVPYNPATGEKAKPNDPATFTDYHTALGALARGGYDGLGVGIFGDLVAIDLDHCINDDGTFAPDAEHIIAIMDAYTEISPSGTGIRIIAKATGYQFDAKKYRINNGQGKEVYVAGASFRYVTVTGDVFRAGALVERGSQLQEVLDLYMVRSEPKTGGTASLPLPAGVPVLSDAEVIEKVAAKYPALWGGDTAAYADDESAADQALCNYLAFYCGRDGEQMDRVFRQSGLMRDKWERRGDYRTATIHKSINGTTSVYDPEHRSQLQASSVEADFADWPLAGSTPPPGETELIASITAGELTEVGNRDLFVAQHGRNYRYVTEPGKWLFWNATKWEWDAKTGGRRQEAAIASILSIRTNVSKALTKHREKSQTLHHTDAMVKLAASHPVIRVGVNQLDAHATKLCTPNGIINLATGELLPPDRSELHTRSTKVEYDPTLPTPRWLKFLSETFGGDQAMIDYVQRLAGYSATGEVTHHVLPFLHGAGANGKSVFLEVLRTILGDYATSAPSGFLMATTNKQHPTELASLSGARLVIASEVNERDRFDEQKVKELTGGDAIKARFMRQDEFLFNPTHTLWLMGNNQPKVETGGESFWRRLRLIPFTNTVPKESRIPGLARILVAEEGAGILAWIAQGAKEVITTGELGEPESVIAATRQYADEEDAFATFTAERLIIGTGRLFKTPTPKVWAAYENWCDANGERTVTRTAFGRRLAKLGVLKAGKSHYWDITVLDGDDDETGADEMPTEWYDR